MRQDKGDFNKALDIMVKYQSLEEAKRHAETYAAQANKIIASLPKNKFSQSLIKICKFVFNRKN